MWWKVPLQSSRFELYRKDRQRFCRAISACSVLELDSVIQWHSVGEGHKVLLNWLLEEHNTEVSLCGYWCRYRAVVWTTEQSNCTWGVELPELQPALWAVTIDSVWLWGRSFRHFPLTFPFRDWMFLGGLLSAVQLLRGPFHGASRREQSWAGRGLVRRLAECGGSQTWPRKSDARVEPTSLLQGLAVPLVTLRSFL